MTEFQKDILALLKAALLDEEPVLSGSTELRSIYAFAEAQQILPALFEGVQRVPQYASHPTLGTFFQRYCVHIAHDADQRDTVDRITKAFEAAGISHMPVKGTLLKPLYPNPEMRTMGDADILIRMEEYSRVEAVMTSLGCVFEYESDHEYSWKTATGLQIEIHKRLIPTYNKDYYAYYGDGWDFARPCEGSTCRYEMSKEDMLVYLLSHYAKHYRDQGAGLKYVVDFLVFERAYPELDMRYVQNELKKLRLEVFYENIQQLLRVWFYGAPSTELTDYMTDKIFDDGVFGKSEKSAVAEGVKLSQGGKSARKEKRRQLFFPSYDSMCRRYPVLKTWAILLPLLWIVRLVDLALHHRDRYRRGMNRVDRMSDENVEQYRRELNYVGLDYNFGGDDPPTKRE